MEGDGDGDVRADEATHGVGDGEGEGEWDGDGEGDGEADTFADGDGEGVGVGAKQASRALVEVFGVIVAAGPGPTLARNSATGTTTMPTTTASTNVTAPHSRRMKAQLTKREV